MLLRLAVQIFCCDKESKKEGSKKENDIGKHAFVVRCEKKERLGRMEN